MAQETSTTRRWSLVVDPRDLATLGGSATPLPVTVRAMENGDRVEALQLTVGPAVARP